MTEAVAQAVPRGIVCTEADVFYSSDVVLTITPGLIGWLIEQARCSARKRSRLCAHPDPEARVHEMIIVHHFEVYVRPHRHATKSESFHRISGAASIVLFHSDGAVDRVFECDGSADAPLYFRIPAGTYHTFIVRSEWLVFHETTAGPFRRSLMEFAPWAPDDQDPAAVAQYVSRLGRKVQEVLDRGLKPPESMVGDEQTI